MKKTIVTVALAVATLTAGSAFAQANTASTTASANARVVAAITISKTADLNFGDVVAGASLGTVLMTPAGVRSATGGTTLGNTAGAAVAAFDVTGFSGATYAILLPVAPITISSSGNTMTVTGFTGSKGLASTLTGGADSFTVGATLNVAASQAAGVYAGNFPVSVNYN